MKEYKTYDEEMADLFKSLNLKNFEYGPTPEELKSKPSDWAEMTAKRTLHDAETTKMVRLSSAYAKDSSIAKEDNQSNKWIPLGTIEHVEAGKTTLSAAIAKSLNLKPEDIKKEKEKDKEIIEDVKNETKKRRYYSVDCTNKVSIALLLAKENIQKEASIDILSREECWARALTEIQVEDISKNNNKLVLSPKEYGQRLKKKGKNYGKKN